MVRRATAYPILAALLVFVQLVSCLAGDAEKSTEWQWRGPARDGKSTEKDLLKRWPKGGPKLLWTATGCGKGFSSVAIKDGMIYTAGTIEKKTYVLAFDLDGNLKWKALNGQEWVVP